MIDLHLHLDGSLSVETALFLAKEQKIPLPTTDAVELKELLCAPKNCRDLNEYLTRFDLPLQVLQTKGAICYAVYDLIKRLDSQGLWYAELRFAPQLHQKQGLTQFEVVQAALYGMEQALHETNIKVQFILCCMRGNEKEAENVQTVKVAREFLNGGVAAIDLAGAEGIYRTATFEPVFTLAKKLEIPFTIHAGEADGAQSVKDAVRFGAKRIGHGLHAREDRELVKLLSEYEIAVELCPTSNLQTKAIQSLAEYPVRDYLCAGIVATINTDNMTVSDTDIYAEFALLKREIQLSRNEEKQLLMNSVRAAFTVNPEKERLYELVEKKFK
jgi:adenosine deaminase